MGKQKLKRKKKFDIGRLLICVERATRDYGLTWKEVKPGLYHTTYFDYFLQYCHNTKRLYIYYFSGENYIGFIDLTTDKFSEVAERLYENILVFALGYKYYKGDILAVDPAYYESPSKEKYFE